MANYISRTGGQKKRNISVHEIIQSYSEKADETSVVDRKKWWDFRPR